MLTSANDLDAYTQRFTAEVEKTGLENAILRKALGNVYYNNGNYKQAAIHLQAAINVQRNDVETHRKLIETYDRMKTPDKAIHQLLEAIMLSGHNLELYQDLATRYIAQDAWMHPNVLTPAWLR